MPKTKSGFTIVELLIVIVVIAILAAITVVAFNGIQDRARKSSQQATLTQTERSIMTLAAQNGGDINAVNGMLIGYQDGTGSSLLSKPLVNAQDVTIYSVFDSTDTSNYNSPLFLTKDDTNSRFKLQAAQSGSSGMGFRIDTAAPQTNLTQYQAGVRTPSSSRAIGWFQVSGSTAWSFAYNQPNAFNSGILTPHPGFSYTGLTNGNYGGMTGLAGLIFNANHDQSTRLQVMKWLAQKYNVPVSL